jgi:hypothetical protein
MRQADLDTTGRADVRHLLSGSLRPFNCLKAGIHPNTLRCVWHTAFRIALREMLRTACLSHA